MTQWRMSIWGIFYTPLVTHFLTCFWPAPHWVNMRVVAGNSTTNVNSTVSPDWWHLILWNRYISTFHICMTTYGNKNCFVKQILRGPSCKVTIIKLNLLLSPSPSPSPPSKKVSSPVPHSRPSLKTPKPQNPKTNSLELWTGSDIIITWKTWRSSLVKLCK